MKAGVKQAVALGFMAILALAGAAFANEVPVPAAVEQSAVPVPEEAPEVDLSALPNFTPEISFKADCGGFPPCRTEWECRSNECGGMGSAYRRTCWASPFYCSPWEKTPICC